MRVAIAVEICKSDDAHGHKIMTLLESCTCNTSRGKKRWGGNGEDVDCYKDEIKLNGSLAELGACS